MQGNFSHFPLKSRFAILPVKREGGEEEAQLVYVSMTVAVNQGNGDSGMTSPHGDTENNFFHDVLQLYIGYRWRGDGATSLVEFEIGQLIRGSLKRICVSAQYAASPPYALLRPPPKSN